MTLHVALRLGRVSNLPTVTSNTLAAIALSGSRAGWPAIATVCVAMSLLYIAGMFLNDAFDHQIDAVERPDRPIPAGEVTAIAVFMAGFVLLASGVLAIAGLAFATGAGWAPVGSVLVLAGLIVFYDMHHKQNRLAPFVMGMCRVCVYTTAALATSAPLCRELLIGCGALLAYLIGLTYVARQENLSRVTNLWPLLFLGVPFAITAPPHLHGPFAFGVYVLFALWTLRSLNLIRKRQIRPAVTSLIAGISLLDALFIARLDHPVMAAVAVAAFVLTTVFQRKIAGT